MRQIDSDLISAIQVRVNPFDPSHPWSFLPFAWLPRALVTCGTLLARRGGRVFCPSCGTQERESHQFCRACGGDLRSVRAGMQLATNPAGSAVTAKEEIGRAVAAKIRDLKSAKELSKVVEEVLPQIEKFLEAPEERRLRRLRAGIVLQALGIGGAILFILFSTQEPDIFPVSGLGILVFLIGLAIFLNGRYLTVPSSSKKDEERMRLRDVLDQPQIETGIAMTDADVYPAPPPSVVEPTTRGLSDVTRASHSRSTAE